VTNPAGVSAPRSSGADLPHDLTKPRHDYEDIRLWAGIIVGGALLALTVALLAVGIAPI
jgi:hypothetical protein